MKNKYILKENIQKGIISFILTVNIIMILLIYTFMNYTTLNIYPIALYLLAFVLWWEGNVIIKVGVRILHIMLTLILSILCFMPDLHNLCRLDTFRNRLFNLFGSEIFTGLIILVILSTIGLFLVNPKNKFKPSVLFVTKLGKFVIIFVWMYIFLVLLEQSYFIARYNIAPANFYAWIKDNNLFWFRDFIYGRIPYLLALTDVLFQFSLFWFIALSTIYTKFYKAFVFNPVILNIILLVCFLSIFISIVNNRIIEFILGIGISCIYLWLLNRLFLYTDNLQVRFEKLYSGYSNRKIIKLWFISIVSLYLFDSIYYIASLSYSNFYIVTKILLLLCLAIFTTIFITRFSKKIRLQ